MNVELVRVKSYCEWVGGSCGSTPCVTVTTATAAASTAGESAARRERKGGSTLETRISGNNKLESTLFPPPSTCDKRSQDVQGALFENV